jgi:hypothetical protein
MPNEETNEPLLIAGAVVSFLGFWPSWFSGADGRDWGSDQFGSGLRLSLWVLLVLVGVVGLWARTSAFSPFACVFSLFVVLLTLCSLGIAGARAASKIDYLDEINVFGAVFLLFGLALIVVGSISAFVRSRTDDSVNGLESSLSSMRADVRALVKDHKQREQAEKRRNEKAILERQNELHAEKPANPE